MKNKLNYLLATIFLLSFINCNNSETAQKEGKTVEKGDKIAKKGSKERVEAELTSPPNVPKPVGDRPAQILDVNMEIIEKEGTITDGTTYVYWTFGGTVPGSFIRTRVGDEINFTLSNHPDNKLPHNIDLHAVTGPGGGATSSYVAPGQEKTFSFKALQPGLFVYHCATAPVGMHIANGMYGLILVEPEGGLPKVDKEYYVMQGDFYTEGENGAPGLQAFDINKAVDEDADYVVFNGRVGSLTGDNALTAKVGETVRLFVGNGGPNLTSSFHVIGEIFDNVHIEAGSSISENVQTTSVPPGGAAIVDFKVEVPGTFILVDHAIFRAFNKGALGMLKVEGEENIDIYSGVVHEGAYNPGNGGDQNIGKEEAAEVAEVEVLSLEEKMKKGKEVFSSTCMARHQATGQGIPEAFPPLAKSDYLNADVDRAIGIVLNGKKGEITVNGQKYNGIMTKQVLTDQEVANVLTYVYNSWGNNKTEVKLSDVQRVKNGH